MAPHPTQLHLLHLPYVFLHNYLLQPILSAKCNPHRPNSNGHFFLQLLPRCHDDQHSTLRKELISQKDPLPQSSLAFLHSKNLTFQGKIAQEPHFFGRYWLWDTLGSQSWHSQQVYSHRFQRPGYNNNQWFDCRGFDSRKGSLRCTI